MTHWKNLIVTDEGFAIGTLGDTVADCPSMLGSAVVRDGKVQYWPGFFLSAPGEEPDWDTPRGPVDWTGFVDALFEARGQ